MCSSNKFGGPTSGANPLAFASLTSEEALARKCGWFAVKYYNGNKVRYVFVDVSRYGLVHHNVLFFFGLHVYFCYAIYTLFSNRLWEGWIWVFWYGWFSGVGTTMGAHRLWSHRSYEARLPLRILLAMLQTMAGQNEIFTWVRDHRLHHKFTETDADPHNSRRGAFFAHVGWLLTKKHPDVHLKGKTINNDDVINDPVVYYQKKYYVPLYLFFRLYLPIWFLTNIWGEQLHHAAQGVFAQYIVSLHITWFVNSAAHIFGDRPYNDKIQPRENFSVSILALGEGYHNYHHVFPWDYGIAESGFKYYDPAKNFIDLMAFFGLAYNLKKASPKLVEAMKDKIEKNHNSVDWYVNDHPYVKPHDFK